MISMRHPTYRVLISNPVFIACLEVGHSLYVIAFHNKVDGEIYFFDNENINKVFLGRFQATVRCGWCSIFFRGALFYGCSN